MQDQKYTDKTKFMHNSAIFKFILQEITAGRSVMLLTVAHTQGSSAGKAGFKCAVAQDKTLGNLGGGSAEHILIKEARLHLSAAERISYLKELIHNPKAQGAQSGMICSGRQSTLIHKFTPAHINMLKALTDSSEFRKPPCLLRFSNDESYLKQNVRQSKRIQFEHEGERFLYSEQIGLPDTLYIVGGGHVGAAAAKIFADLDFYVKVFDNRKNLELFKNINTAHEKIVIEYNQFHLQLKPNEKQFILIMTAEHHSDQTVLAQALKSEAVYIGMLGSEAKIRTIFKNLKAQGFSEDDLKRVHSPVGLPIACETPAEIAVSIAAQIIDIRNKHA